MVGGEKCGVLRRGKGRCGEGVGMTVHSSQEEGRCGDRVRRGSVVIASPLPLHRWQKKMKKRPVLILA